MQTVFLATFLVEDYDVHSNNKNWEKFRIKIGLSTISINFLGENFNLC